MLQWIWYKMMYIFISALLVLHIAFLNLGLQVIASSSERVETSVDKDKTINIDLALFISNHSSEKESIINNIDRMQDRKTRRNIKHSKKRKHKKKSKKRKPKHTVSNKKRMQHSQRRKANFEHNNILNSRRYSENEPKTLREGSKKKFKKHRLDNLHNKQSRNFKKHLRNMNVVEKTLNQKLGDIFERKIKRKKHQILSKDNFVKQTTTLSEQNYHNTPEKIFNLGLDLSDLDNIKNTSQNYNILKIHHHHKKHKKSKKGESKPTYSFYMIPKFGAIESRLKFIKTSNIEFENDFTPTTKFVGLRMFSGPYSILTTTTAYETKDFFPKAYETDKNLGSLENDNMMFLIDKPDSKELTNKTDIDELIETVIDDIIRNSQSSKETFKDDQVTLNDKKSDEFKEKDILKHGDKSSHEIFSELEGKPKNASNVLIHKRFNIVFNDNNNTQKDYNNSNEAVTTNPGNESDITISSILDDGTTKDKYSNEETKTASTRKPTAGWKRLQYISSYSDEEDVINKNIYRALHMVPKPNQYATY